MPRSQSELSVVQQRLMRAGYRNDAAVKLFYGAKILAHCLFWSWLQPRQSIQVGGFFV